MSAARTAVLAVGLGIGLLVLGLWMAGYDPVPALDALWRGAFGSWYAIASGTLVRAVPLVLIGVGICVAFRAAAFNIGAEGQFYAGAVAATWIGLHAGAWPPPLGLLALVAGAGIAGGAWVVVPVWLKLRLGVLEVISTLLLNFVAESLVSWMVQGPMQEPTHIYPQSQPIAAAARLPLLPGTRLHAGALIAVAAAVGAWWILSRTVWGFEVLAAGTGPRAAAVSGRVDVARVGAAALLWSGVLAGVAGGVEVAGVSYALFQSLSPGYGFTGIAVALLARLNPLGVLATGVLFGALEVGAAAMQRDAGVPAVAVYAVEAVIIVIILMVEAGARRARPEASAT
ncbi:MAG TPA: ABC transporter permease [Gemmatimonadales bacterium]|nr:ABC transporter permease [Gemmatimonadales bacterium]